MYTINVFLELSWMVKAQPYNIKILLVIES